MLGRLGMTANDCVRAYRELAREAFTSKRTTILPASPAGAYSAKSLESAIKKTVRKFCTMPKCTAGRTRGLPTGNTCSHSDLEFRNPACTKT